MNNLSQSQKRSFRRQKNMSIYLCGPIKDCTDEQVHGWRDRMKVILAGYPITFLDPTVRDYRRVLEANIGNLEELERIDDEIVTQDSEEIRMSDALIVYFPQPSAGSAMEIYMAHHLHRFVVTIVPFVGTASPWVRYHSTVTVESFPDAIHQLKRYFPTVFGSDVKEEYNVIKS